MTKDEWPNRALTPFVIRHYNSPKSTNKFTMPAWQLRDIAGNADAKTRWRARPAGQNPVFAAPT
jgi:hypothetical protein